MDRREYAHRVADINEAIYDTEKELERIRFQLLFGEESRKEWYLAAQAKETAELERLKQLLTDFCNEYRDVF